MRYDKSASIETLRRKILSTLETAGDGGLATSAICMAVFEADQCGPRQRELVRRQIRALKEQGKIEPAKAGVGRAIESTYRIKGRTLQ